MYLPVLPQLSCIMCTVEFIGAPPDTGVSPRLSPKQVYRGPGVYQDWDCVFNITQGGRGCAFACSQGWSARLLDRPVIHTRHPDPLQSSGCCSSSLWSTSCWLSTWTTCWRMRTVSCTAAVELEVVVHCAAFREQRKLTAAKQLRRHWMAPICQPAPLHFILPLRPPTLQACARAPLGTCSPPPTGRAGAAGAPAARTWSAPLGGGGDEGERDTGRACKGKETRAQRAVPVKPLPAGCAWHPGSVAPSVGAQPT